MCGIVGYVGRQDAWPLIYAGLQRLEYRGYDSAGIAVVDNAGRLHIARTVGKVRGLQPPGSGPAPQGALGLGHTRWATHGRPSHDNAHPHTDCRGRIALVHNGIVENYLPLKRRLAAEGHRFSSETDSEVLAHLVEEGLEQGLEFAAAFRRMAQLITGSQAIAATLQDGDGPICAVRVGYAGGLLVSHYDGQGVVGSDLPALLPLLEPPAAAAPRPENAAASLSDDVRPLADGVEQHPANAARLADDAARLSDNAGEYPDGAGQPLDTAARFSDTVARHPDNVGQHPDTAAALADTVARHPDGAGQHPDAAAQHPDSTGQHPASTAQHPDNAARFSDSTGQHPDTAARHPDSTGQHPDTTAHHSDNAGDYPDSAARHPVDAGQHTDSAQRLSDTAGQHPDSAARHPDNAGQHPDNAAILSDTAAQHPDTAGHHPDTAGHHPDTAGHHPDTTAQHPDSAPCHTDTTAPHPDTATEWAGRAVAFLEDGEMAVVSREGVAFCDLDGNAIVKQPRPVSREAAAADRGGYRHYMLKEIMEQPQAMLAALRGRVNFAAGLVELPELAPLAARLPSLDRVVLIGCGTSLHAAQVGRHLVERLSGMPAEAESASEFRYRDPYLGPRTLVVSIGQSGETADTIAAMQLAREKGAPVITICNAEDSQAARLADATLPMRAGLEIGVASTKTFIASLTILNLLALYLGQHGPGQQRGGMDAARRRELLDWLGRGPRLLGELLADTAPVEAAARRFNGYNNFLFLGRGSQAHIAQEGALKLKEITYIHAEGYPAGEMKHGPIALIDAKMATVALAPRDALYDKVANNIKEVQARDGQVLAVLTAGDRELAPLVDAALFIPEAPPHLAPILITPLLQLLSYHIAVRRGCDVDQPRNLAKSVTVE